MRLVMCDMTVCLEILKPVGQTRMLENQDLPLVNIYVSELLNGCGPVRNVNENIIVHVEVMEDICAEFVESNSLMCLRDKLMTQHLDPRAW